MIDWGAGLIDADTGARPRCFFCDSVDKCKHRLAFIDRMDLQCEGGALFGRHNEFATEIESAFLKVLRSGAEAKWQDPPVEYFIIEELWNAAHAEYDGENSFVRLNKSIFWSFMIQLLEETGAESYPGRVEFQGGPGMSSEISILYADEPDAVIDEALRSLRSLLS